MQPVVEYRNQDGIGVVTIDSPPVNALSQAVRAGLLEALSQAAADKRCQALVLLCAGRTFIAGADISEFGRPPLEPALAQVLEALESFPRPVIAAIHGTALGGGFETALCCHYRCALPSARVGLPEVKLGLLPGAGGTQRTPRLCGPAAALEMIGSGTPQSATQALELGLIDRVIDGELGIGAVAWARELVASAAPLRRVRDLPVEYSDEERARFAATRQRLLARARGQLAPQQIVRCLEAAIDLPFDEGLVRERELFLECMRSPQSAALRHLFFAERAAARVKDLPADTVPRDVRRVGVVGAGTMGGGIAMSFANAGFPVRLVEVDEDALDRGMAKIRDNYATSARRGRLSGSDVEQRLALISGGTAYEGLADVDLVVEAVFEDPQLKSEVFTRLDRVCRPGAILASNTSYQDIDALAAATQRPGDVVGMHFFSPAQVMRLLENVRGTQTAPEVIATAMQIGRRIGKIPVLAGVCYGFIGNRMLRPYAQQAALLIMEGATPAQVDAAMEAFGMAMGPFAVGDLAGLDIGYRARQALPESERGDPRTYRVADLLVERGRCGQKTAAGYYRYDAGGRERRPDPEVEALIVEEALRLGVPQRRFDDATIQARLLDALVNEGARVLGDGIAQRASDIDIVYVHGYGFPAWRGGPMFHGDQQGLAAIRDRIAALRSEYGADLWPTAPLLDKLAVEGGTFAALN